VSLAIVGLFLPLTSFSQAEDARLARGRAALDKNRDCFAAIEALESVSVTVRDNPSWMLYMARTHECLENPAVALSFYEQYRKHQQDPDVDSRIAAIQSRLRTQTTDTAVTQAEGRELQVEIENLNKSAEFARGMADYWEYRADRAATIASTGALQAARLAAEDEIEFKQRAELQRQNAVLDEIRIADLRTRLAALTEVLGDNSASNADSTNAGGLRLIAVKFFESDSKLPALEDRTFETIFSQSQSRFIDWQLEFRRQPTVNSATIRIEALYYHPDGRLYTRSTSSCTVRARYAGVVCSSGRGSPKPGSWDKGLHTVDFYVEGRKLYSSGFEVR
jgi:hypothetical protein